VITVYSENNVEPISIKRRFTDRYKVAGTSTYHSASNGYDRGNVVDLTNHIERVVEVPTVKTFLPKRSP
jgi:hypothetical protein